MNVLFAVSEARPYASSGGLSDVAESLPKCLCRHGIDCRIALPLYDTAPKDLRRSGMRFVDCFDVPVSWRRQHCEVFQATFGGVTYYLLNNTYYFKRGRLYGEPDEAERFAFFSRAVLEMLPRIGFQPDIIHANDWQTALVPVYKDAFYAKDEWYAGMKTVFTIHNLKFQGQFDADTLGNVFGLEDGSPVENNGEINLLKGALETADALVTVSPSYAREIAGDSGDSSGYDFGEGMTPLIKSVEGKLTGILNGASADPATDPDLEETYDIQTFPAGKAANKRGLQARLGLELIADAPLLGMVTRISGQKGCELVLKMMEDDGPLACGDVQFVLLGSAADGDEEGGRLEEAFIALAERNKGRMAVYIGFAPELAQRIYAAADIFLMPSRFEPCGLGQIIALKYGTVPVVRGTGGLADTVRDCADGTGNGYVFAEYDAGPFGAAIDRALKDYRDRAGWDALIRRAMACDYSWDAGSVQQYIALYEKLQSQTASSR